MYLLDPHSFEIASWGCWYTFFSKQSYSPMMFMSLQLQLTLDKNVASMSSSLVTFSIGNKEEIIESMVGFASLYPCGRIKPGSCKPCGNTHLSTPKHKKKSFEGKIMGVEEKIMMEIALGSPFASSGSIDIFWFWGEKGLETTTFTKSCVAKVMLSTIINKVSNNLPTFPFIYCFFDIWQVDTFAKVGQFNLHVINDYLSTLFSSTRSIPFIFISCYMFCSKICKIEEIAIGDKAHIFTPQPHLTQRCKVKEKITLKQGA